MDRITLHNPNYNYFSFEKLQQKLFTEEKSITDTRKNTTTKIYQNNRGITLINNGFGTRLIVNPTKFIQGHNFKQIDRLQLRDFVQEFEQYLNFSTNNFSLTQFDYNQDIYLNSPVYSYMPIFRGNK